MRYLSALVMIALAALWACKSDSSNPVSTYTSIYLPMAEGDWWVYTLYDMDSTGARVPGSERTEKDSVIGTASVGGRTAFLMRTVSDTTTDTTRSYIDARGALQMWNDTSSDGSGKGMWSTVIPGVTETVNDSVPFSLGLTTVNIGRTVYSIVGATQRLTVPAGTFDAQLRIDSSSANTAAVFPGAVSTSSLTVYLVSHVGMVKNALSVHSVLPGFGSFRGISGQELISYHVQ